MTNDERKAKWEKKIVYHDSRKEKAEKERLDELKKVKEAEALKAKEVPIIMNTPKKEILASEKIAESKQLYVTPDSKVKKDLINKFKLSYIEEYEEQEAKRQIEDALGFEPLRVTGWQIAVKVFERPEDFHEFVTETGERKVIYLPDTLTSHDKFINPVGLVINMGPDCYKGPAFQGPMYLRILRKFFGRWMKPDTFVPWCKVGDWVIFHRNAGPQIKYRDHPVTIIEDKHILSVVACPSYVQKN